MINQFKRLGTIKCKKSTICLLVNTSYLLNSSLRFLKDFSIDTAALDAYIKSFIVFLEYVQNTLEETQAWTFNDAALALLEHIFNKRFYFLALKVVDQETNFLMLVTDFYDVIDTIKQPLRKLFVALRGLPFAISCMIILQCLSDNVNDPSHETTFLIDVSFCAE